MYVRLLLIVAVVPTVFAVTSFSRVNESSEIAVARNVETVWHPNPMTDHEAHLFISELTGRMLCFAYTQAYVDCSTGVHYQGPVGPGWTDVGECDGLDSYRPNGWLISQCANATCHNPPTGYDACEGESCSSRVGVVRECDSLLDGECQAFCYFDCESLWDAVKAEPCKYLY